MRSLRILPVVVLLSLRLFGAEQWVKLKSPNFELYTTAGEKKGREAILYFEQVRSFFLQTSPSKKVPQFPVRIVAFRSEKEYQPYRASEAAAAYYVHGRSRDYIVMQDILSEHYPAAIHEYAHLIVEGTGLKIPLWLNEGWADLFSSLRPNGNKARVGEPLPGRAVTLITNKWMNLDVLTAVGHDSPLYNERNKAGVFYSESWALTHMLFLSPNYRQNFTKLLVELHQGKAAEDAFVAAYGKHLWEVQVDLHKYLEGGRIYAADFDVKLEKSAEQPEISEATPFESGMVIADLLALVDKHQEAQAAYERLAKSNPNQPEVEESLGYLAWKSDDSEGARAHFAKALAAGTKNAQMCYHDAALEQRQNNTPGAILALRRAVELKPDYVDARLQLGVLLESQRDHAQAIAQLQQIRNVNSEQAARLFSTLAYAYAQSGDDAKARENAENAKKWAKTPDDIQEADALLRYLDQRKAAAERVSAAHAGSGGPPAMRRQEREEFVVKEVTPPKNPFVSKEDKLIRVEGIAQSLDCNGDTLRFRVLVDKKPMAFEIPDPDRVLIKHSAEVKHDFACGPQKPYKVVVEYAELPDKASGTAGIVRSLEF